MAKRNYWRLRRRINRPRDFISSIRSLRFSRQGLSLKRRWSLLHALLHGVAHPGPIDGEARRDGQHAELLEAHAAHRGVRRADVGALIERTAAAVDRKSTRLNSSHGYISYAVFCLK